MSVEGICVDPAQVHLYWGIAAPFIRSAMEIGEGDFATTERHVLEGKALLWFAVEGGDILGAGVTQIVPDHKGKVCNLVAIGGEDWWRWGHTIEKIEGYARNEKCNAVEICGRPGWGRRLTDYRVKNVTLRKELR